MASPAASTTSAAPVLKEREVLKEKESVEARLVEQAEREKSAEEVRKEAEAALKAAKEADLEILNRVYSPEIEAERRRREEFYLGLGVPSEDARRLVARILAAYSDGLVV